MFMRRFSIFIIFKQFVQFLQIHEINDAKSEDLAVKAEGTIFLSSIVNIIDLSRVPCKHT